MTNDQNQDAAARITAKLEKLAHAALTEMLARVTNPEVVKSIETAELRESVAFGLKHKATPSDLAAQIAEAATRELRRRGVN